MRTHAARSTSSAAARPSAAYRWWRYACLSVALASLCACAGVPIAGTQPRIEAQAPTRPNIVLIVVDDMGWRDWSGAGSRFYRTPHIDALAERGARFDQAYSAAAVCSPSRAALMTGKTPARLHITDWIPGEGTPKAPSTFRVPDWTMQLPAAETTLAEALQAFGYRSAYIGKWHLGGVGSLPRDHGFDQSLAAGHAGHPASYFWPYGQAGDTHRVPDLAERGGTTGEYLTDRLTDESIAWISDSVRQYPGRPFLLTLSHYAVHVPLQARDEDLAAVANWTPDRRQDNRTYAAMLHALDRSVGRILKALGALHLDDNTIVVFTSDNGGLDLSWAHPTSNAPLREGKGHAYEGGTRVPLIVAGTGRVAPGLRSNHPVSGVDLLPTLLELAGARSPPSLDGRSFAATLRGDPPNATRPLGWHYPHYWAGRTVEPWSSLRVGDLKVIRFHEDDHWELYDLARDPGERHDLATERPRELARMQRQLGDWLRGQGAQLPVPRHDAE